MTCGLFKIQKKTSFLTSFSILTLFSNPEYFSLPRANKFLKRRVKNSPDTIFSNESEYSECNNGKERFLSSVDTDFLCLWKKEKKKWN